MIAKTRRGQSICCDYCNKQDVELVFLEEKNIDICSDCALVIYNFFKNKILNG